MEVEVEVEEEEEEEQEQQEQEQAQDRCEAENDSVFATTVAQKHRISVMMNAGIQFEKNKEKKRGQKSTM